VRVFEQRSKLHIDEAISVVLADGVLEPSAIAAPQNPVPTVDLTKKKQNTSKQHGMAVFGRFFERTVMSASLKAPQQY
jgi:hypothetical protein